MLCVKPPRPSGISSKRVPPKLPVAHRRSVEASVGAGDEVAVRAAECAEEMHDLEAWGRTSRAERISPKQSRNDAPRTDQVRFTVSPVRNADRHSVAWRANVQGRTRPGAARDGGAWSDYGRLNVHVKATPPSASASVGGARGQQKQR